MIERYFDSRIGQQCTDEEKLQGWQDTELLVLRAKMKLGKVSEEVYQQIKSILEANPIDVTWWKQRDAEIHHDLNAFIDERCRFLPQEFHQYFHDGMTSYDTEELPFQKMLIKCFTVVALLYHDLRETMIQLGDRHKDTVMNGRTHGQEAKLQSFGKRVFSWIAALDVEHIAAVEAVQRLKFSKLSGAIGNYQGVDATIEEVALEFADYKPFYGATQIMPRNIHAGLADALVRMVMVINKIAIDIRLGARSGITIYREPFGKLQKGSSAMPHKRNPIRTEQIEGLSRLAIGYGVAIDLNIPTWEERAIEQSCVERVAWPDLFQITVRSLTVINKVLEGLKVYPDNMELEIQRVYGSYASEDVKEFLKEEMSEIGWDYEDVYRVVQLACFNAFERQSSMENIIAHGELEDADEFEYTKDQIDRWNKDLVDLFSDQDKNARKHFSTLFEYEYQLRNEPILFEQIPKQRERLSAIPKALLDQFS